MARGAKPISDILIFERSSKAKAMSMPPELGRISQECVAAIIYNQRLLSITW
jgi:hypothetical protein